MDVIQTASGGFDWLCHSAGQTGSSLLKEFKRELSRTGNDALQLKPPESIIWQCGERLRLQTWDCRNWCETVFDVLQGANEAIFVPSGWHHSVENVEDTLSINHNWLNAYNIHWGWELMKQEHSDATMAIDDCRSPHPPFRSLLFCSDDATPLRGGIQGSGMPDRLGSSKRVTNGPSGFRCPVSRSDHIWLCWRWKMGLMPSRTWSLDLNRISQKPLPKLVSQEKRNVLKAEVEVMPSKTEKSRSDHI